MVDVAADDLLLTGKAVAVAPGLVGGVPVLRDGLDVLAGEVAQRLSFEDLTLDLESRRVTRAGQSIELQAREFGLLVYLLRNPGRVLSKTMILEHVWNYSFDPQTNVVDVLVSRLRRKIDRDFPIKLIHTLRGVGYVLRKE